MDWNLPNPYQTPPRRGRGVILTTVGAVAAIGIFTIGLVVGNQNLFGVQAESIAATLRISQREAPRKLPSEVSFTQFWDLWDYLKSRALTGSQLKDIDLFYGAQAGLVAALDDPYSVFFAPQKAQEFTQELSGRFDGIGAEIGTKDGRLTVVASLPGSPAESTGLLTGDAILGIGQDDTTGMAVDVAIGKIRGPKGTKVDLTILRGSEVKVFSITRETISIPNIKATYDGDTAILRIYHFNEGAANEFKTAVDDIQRHGAKKLILDLRNNPGGFLDAAVDISSAWLGDQEVVVYEQNAAGQLTPYRARGEGNLRSMTTIVLINEGSASAAEIVAGALQDHGKAKLVGETSFGKGSVQNYRQFSDGSAVKLTIARWLTPNERQINEVGITPDVVVKVDQSTPTSTDPQLDKAKELLK